MSGKRVRMFFRSKNRNYMQMLAQLSLILLIIVSVLFAGLVSILRLNMQSMTELARDMQRNLLEDKRQMVQIVLDQYNNLIYSLVIDRDFRTLIQPEDPASQQTNADMERLFRRYLDIHEDISNLCFVAQSGHRYNQSRTDNVTAGFDVACPPSQEQLLAHIVAVTAADSDAGMQYFSDANRQMHEEYVFHQAIAVYDLYTHEARGVLVVSFVQTTLQQAMANGQDEAAATEETALIAPDGLVMVSADKAMLGMPLDRIATSEKAFSEVNLAVGKHGVAISSILDFSSYMERIDNYQKTFIALVLGGVVVYLLSSYALMKRATRSVNMLMRGFRKIKEGNGGTVLAVESRDEFGYLVSEFNSMSKRLAEMAEAVEKSNREKLHAVDMQHKTLLHSLQSQINFHFLANTINTISAVAIANQDYRVPQLLKALSNSMRYTFQDSDKQTTVQNECDWLNDYLMLQKERAGKQFSFVVRADQQVRRIPIHKLLVQPFVENSIVHGFSGHSYGNLIEIAFRRYHGHGLVISIHDNGNGIPADRAEKIQALFQNGIRCDSIGVGINNVVLRIRLYYPEAKLFLRTGPNGTRIDIFLPYCETAGAQSTEEYFTEDKETLA